MSIEKSVEASENLFRFPQIEPESNTDNTLIFEENSRELEEFLLRENNNADPTDGVFELLVEILNQVQGEFDELLGEDTDKKQFLKSLSKIFALLLNTKVKTVEKILKIIKIALETTVKYGQDKSNSKKNWMMSGRWPEKKKNSLSVQNKTNRTRAKDCKYNQKRTNCKNNQCKKKI